MEGLVILIGVAEVYLSFTALHPSVGYITLLLNAHTGYLGKPCTHNNHCFAP